MDLLVFDLTKYKFKITYLWGNLYVDDDISANNDLFVNNDATISNDLIVSGNQHLVGELYMSGRIRLEREDNPQNAERTWMIYVDDSSTNYLTFDWYSVDENNEPNFDNVTATVVELFNFPIRTFLNENTNVTGDLTVNGVTTIETTTNPGLSVQSTRDSTGRDCGIEIIGSRGNSASTDIAYIDLELRLRRRWRKHSW